ncbi:DNA mismatch repair protein MutS [Polaribacter reichenbachii]|uniref:DNA mismatch repair protein MutS n=1 Tax=Polaribacter reichenbachii TaxID=996801 RepID=A0A1B8U5Z1_9FLAO|nr:DNA mismatch repair protein MutS [Polaribacter reichenbachii]APZ46011.1 DNA mismatch repair protein MutS [Polaribacter reichenbachii]AUC19873.1 DNA mismatch repair protein MutS [Polaribacter reichenbachii]OBY67272.1 DNA mismatch repair protein MutS [Polaribacter reichenbachii]
MKNPLEFYNQRKEELASKSAKLKTKLINLAVFRLIVFLITAFLVYLTFGKYPDVFIIAFLGISLFSFLVIKNINLKREKAILDKKYAINTTEIKVLNGDFYQLETGKEFINPTHFYSNDIDLFGKGSFFQYTNRTATFDGKKALANLFTDNNIDAILAKQNAIKELSDKVNWRQHFSALASLVTVKSTSRSIVSWLGDYTSVFPKYLANIQIGFSVISLLLIGFVSFGFLSFSFLTAWFFIGLFVTGRFLKKTSNLYAETDKARETFKQYHQLLNEIETESFTAKNLLEKQIVIQSENKKASKIFKEFAKILDAFDNRNNIVIAVLGNGLFLWDILNACKVEKWIANYKHTVENWFEVVAYFDAQNSMANFKFNHPKFVFPEISSEKEIIKSTNLGHPLLNVDKRVDNDFIIDDEQFFIVTGANMAGKSTFLRTVSLSIVMANCGLPVCAEKFKYHPIKLITSMRTSDSLTDDESYFYSELKRLKFIVDQIKTEKYFIILDEILKGTNSKDKATGSKKFVEKLTKSKSTGIIATHDVSLCELENEFSGIKNYYFDAEIINDELHFDYTIKNGVCKNMNASFLLQKMEIV